MCVYVFMCVCISFECLFVHNHPEVGVAFVDVPELIMQYLHFITAILLICSSSSAAMLPFVFILLQPPKKKLFLSVSLSSSHTYSHFRLSLPNFLSLCLSTNGKMVFIEYIEPSRISRWPSQSPTTYAPALSFSHGVWCLALAMLHLADLYCYCIDCYGVWLTWNLYRKHLLPSTFPGDDDHAVCVYNTDNDGNAVWIRPIHNTKRPDSSMNSGNYTKHTHTNIHTHILVNGVWYEHGIPINIVYNEYKYQIEVQFNIRWPYNVRVLRQQGKIKWVREEGKKNEKHIL